MTDTEAIEAMRQAVVQPDRSLVAQIGPNTWAKLQFTTANCTSPNCHGESHDESEYSIYHNYHFVIHDVVAVEVKWNYGDGRIRVRAHTAQGDACEGMAADLLRRLSEPALSQVGRLVAPPPIAAEPRRSWFNRLLEG